METNIEFKPFSENKIYLNFQCDTDMSLEQITSDVNDYISSHKTEIYLDRTEVPVYLKQYVLARDDTLWDK